MGILGKFVKQPADVQDYDFDFNEYLSSQSDTAASHTAVADSGITVLSSSMTSGVVKVFLAGGLDGSQYKVTATVTTNGGRVKQGEIVVKIKEV